MHSMNDSISRLQPGRKRGSPYDLSGLTFRIATDTDRDALLMCRWKGYRQYGYASPDACRNHYDGRATQFICVDEASDETLGCLRMLSRLDGPLELEQFADISAWADVGVVPAELTRFSIPLSHRLPAIKNGLMKLAWLKALESGHTHFIISTQEKTKPAYEVLGFHHYLGRPTTFLHPAISNHLHYVMILDLIADTLAWRKREADLYRFFWLTEHPALLLQPEHTRGTDDPAVASVNPRHRAAS
jgi:hypothetical protein